MVRRLSITVPDELWDELTHLDPSPSALVQRALRCLRDTEGFGAGPTPLEALAGNTPGWQEAIDDFIQEAKGLRNEGYDAVFAAYSDRHNGVITFAWLEMIARDYKVKELPRFMSEAADTFLAQKHSTDEFANRPVTPDDVLEMLFDAKSGVRGGPSSDDGAYWDDDHRELLIGMCNIIALQEEGLLGDQVNGLHFRIGPDGMPTTDIPYSLFEGMTAAIFDTVAEVRRRVEADKSHTVKRTIRVFNSIGTHAEDDLVQRFLAMCDNAKGLEIRYTSGLQKMINEVEDLIESGALPPRVETLLRTKHHVFCSRLVAFLDPSARPEPPGTQLVGNDQVGGDR